MWEAGEKREVLCTDLKRPKLLAETGAHTPRASLVSTSWTSYQSPCRSLACRLPSHATPTKPTTFFGGDRAWGPLESWSTGPKGHEKRAAKTGEGACESQRQGWKQGKRGSGSLRCVMEGWQRAASWALTDAKTLLVPLTRVSFRGS